MERKIKIGSKHIGEGCPCYIIAEMSANHAMDFDNAIKIIHLAKESGADAIKIQTYTADTMTLNSRKEQFLIKEGTWEGANLYELYQQAYTPWEWQARLKEEADKIGIDFFSTPFDKRAVDFLESIGVEFYKIASFELVDIPLLKYVASKGKPIIMSTGMGTLGEIEEAVSAIRGEGNNQLCLLKCSSEYPANPENMNLNAIRHISETFNVPAGLSDHSVGPLSAVVAVSLGAKVIEKHFCISREIKNPDSTFSMEPAEFKKMVEDIRIVEKALGEAAYKRSNSEKTYVGLRRSIWVAKDIKEGEIFTEENLRVVRPGHGLEPKFFKEILGKKANSDVEEATPLKWNMIE